MNNPNVTESLRKYIEDFLKECTDRQLSGSTVQTYRGYLQQFCVFIEGMDGELTEENVRNYFDTVQKKYKQTTAKAKFAPVSLFLDYLVIHQILPENPIYRLKGKQKSKLHRQKVLAQVTDAEKADFYAAMERDCPTWNLLTEKEKEEEFQGHKSIMQHSKEASEIAKKLQNLCKDARQDNKGGKV